jgi:cytoskeleton protein RodZ
VFDRKEDVWIVEELGRKLRQIRLERGIDLNDVQEQTKIRIRYLEAIEEGKWDLLPGQVYAKGFIRSYAEYLGLDSQQLLEEYGLNQPSPPPVSESVTQKVQPPSSTRNKKPPVASERSMWPQFAAGAAILAVIIAGYVYFTHGATHSGNPSEASNTAKTNLSTVTDSNQQQAKPPSTQEQTPALPPKPAVEIKLTNKTAQGETLTVHNADHLQVELTTPNGRCWVSATVDGKEVYSGILEQGVAQSWTANKSVLLATGNSSAIQLKVNGQDVSAVDFKGPFTYSFQVQ